MAENHRRYDHEAAEQETPRGEWVSLRHGDVWVRSLTASEFISIQDRASRPKEDPRGGVDRGWSLFLQIAYSCFEDDTPMAKPLWPSSLDRKSMAPIARLSLQDFTSIINAIERVNGQSADEEQSWRDFTEAAGALIPSE